LREKTAFLQNNSASVINYRQEIPFVFAPIKEIKSIHTAKDRKIKTSGLGAMLGLLFPRKADYFASKDQKTLGISCIPEGPFGPDPEVLLAQFLPDFFTTLSLIVERLGLEGALVLGYAADYSDMPKIRFSKKMYAEDRGKLILNLHEFLQLSLAVAKGLHSGSRFVSVFISEADKFCFFTSGQTELGRLCESEPLIAAKIKKNPGCVLCNPLTGESYRPEDRIEDKNIELVCLVRSGQSISFGRGGLFSFPFFRKKLHMQIIPGRGRSVHPCQNCLGCVRYCPAGLHPAYLYHYLINGGHEEARTLDLTSCTGCGRCSMVCPSNLPLTGTITASLGKDGEEEE